MLDYTRSILDKTKKDFEITLTLFQFGTQIAYILYLIYVLFTHSSIWYLYLALLVVSVIFFIFDVSSKRDVISLKEMTVRFWHRKKHKEALSHAKKKRKTIKQLKFYISHGLKMLVLASSLYPIITSPYSVHPINIIFTTIMALLWIVQIVLEAMKVMVNARMDMFSEALHADIELVTKPINAIKNKFKQLTGKEIEEAEPSKHRAKLDEIVEEWREEKAAKKAEERAKRKEKLSDWLDSHLSKFNRSKNDDEDKDFVTVTDDAGWDDDK